MTVKKLVEILNMVSDSGNGNVEIDGDEVFSVRIVETFLSGMDKSYQKILIKTKKGK